MNSKVARNNQSPINMFGASTMHAAARKVNAGGSVTYYNRKPTTGQIPTTDRIRRKTEPTEPVSIPSPRNGSPFNGNSPRGGSPRGGSPQNGSFYAGAKFSEPPSPATLPKPPSHWVNPGHVGGCRLEISQESGNDKYQVISNQLKMLLNIRA